MCGLQLNRTLGLGVNYVYKYNILWGAGIVNLVQWQTRDWMAAVWFPEVARYFSLLHSIQTSSGAHLVSYPLGTWGSFPGGEATASEAYDSPPCSNRVKSGGAMFPCHGAWLIKHRDNFTFTSHSCVITAASDEGRDILWNVEYEFHFHTPDYPGRLHQISQYLKILFINCCSSVSVAQCCVCPVCS
jgi:hypothetical protein